MTLLNFFLIFISVNALIFISTLNKNIISKFLAIDVAEKYLKLLPKNTHDDKYFLKPSEIQNLANNNRLHLVDVSGMTYNPFFKSFKLSKIDLVNYFISLRN